MELDHVYHQDNVLIIVVLNTNIGQETKDVKKLAET